MRDLIWDLLLAFAIGFGLWVAWLLGWIEGVLQWIDRHAAAFLVLGLIGLSFLGARVFRDEHATKTEARHTRKVQVQGAPVAVCLLDALRAVTPLLEKAPNVDKPLEAYVRLQSHRYPGVVCPDK